MIPSYTRSDHLRLIATTFRDIEHCIKCGAVDGHHGARDHRGHWWSTGAIVCDYGFVFEDNPNYAKNFGDALPELVSITDALCDVCREEGGD